LNFFSEYGEKARSGAVIQAEGILTGANIEVRSLALPADRRLTEHKTVDW